jgi:hypothetical protein
MHKRCQDGRMARVGKIARLASRRIPTELRMKACGFRWIAVISLKLLLFVTQMNANLRANIADFQDTGEFRLSPIRTTAIA